MKKILFVLGFVLVSIISSAQSMRFANEIQYFKKQDSAHFPAPNQILFVGSSSFTKWKDVQTYFPEYPIINRGFGGSSLPDVIFYAKDVILPYQPKQVVIYCGENDFTAPGGITADTVLGRVKKLVELIREKYPKLPIAYISIKPSPSRMQYQPEVKKANKLIKKYLRKKKNADFINVYDAMLNADGTMNKEIYLSDDLHMNAKGYAIWQKIILPYLKE